MRRSSAFRALACRENCPNDEDAKNVASRFIRSRSAAPNGSPDSRSVALMTPILPSANTNGTDRYESVP